MLSYTECGGVTCCENSIVGNRMFNNLNDIISSTQVSKNLMGIQCVLKARTFQHHCTPIISKAYPWPFCVWRVFFFVFCQPSDGAVPQHGHPLDQLSLPRCLPHREGSSLPNTSEAFMGRLPGCSICSCSISVRRFISVAYLNTFVHIWSHICKETAALRLAIPWLGGSYNQVNVLKRTWHRNY